jgi:transcription elongation factor Elf1
MPVELAQRTRVPLKRVEGTCETEACPVSTVTLYVKDHEVPAMIVCPVCGQAMKLGARPVETYATAYQGGRV